MLRDNPNSAFCILNSAFGLRPLSPCPPTFGNPIGTPQRLHCHPEQARLRARRMDLLALSRSGTQSEHHHPRQPFLSGIFFFLQTCAFICLTFAFLQKRRLFLFFILCILKNNGYCIPALCSVKKSKNKR